MTNTIDRNDPSMRMTGGYIDTELLGRVVAEKKRRNITQQEVAKNVTLTRKVEFEPKNKEA